MRIIISRKLMNLIKSNRIWISAISNFRRMEDKTVGGMPLIIRTS
jgi:hypothetical protein